MALHVADTERLSLHDLALTDAAFVLELVNDPDWLDDVDIGYALLPAYRGQGYAHEAAATATCLYVTETDEAPRP